MEFNHIDKFDRGAAEKTSGNSTKIGQGAWAPEKLENGKWACNHKCKDKKGYVNAMRTVKAC